MDVRPERHRPGPSLDPGGQQVTFRVDQDARWRPLRVWYHLRGDGAEPVFRLEDDQWVARIPRPPVGRLEYLLVAGWEDGGQSMVPDPANPLRVRGVFGEKSVIEFPGYAQPWWVWAGQAAAAARDAGAGGELVAGGLLSHGGTEQQPPPAEGVGTLVRTATRPAGGDDRFRRWSATSSQRGGELISGAAPDPAEVVDGAAEVTVAGRLLVPADSSADERLPLVVVHDGPEYAEFCDLARYLEVLAGLDPRLRCRALLLAPRDRDRCYSASPAYARALATGMLPQVTRSVATRGPLVGIGSSLGGLAMLHVAVRHHGVLGAVFCQSGSFFQPGTDDMERDFRYFGRITRFVDELHADPSQLSGLRLALTCGTGEDNLANNRALARRLARSGVPVELGENPDGHNHVGWRDSLDPGLHRLLWQAWAAPTG